VVGAVNAVSGITAVDLPSPTPGTYTIQTVNIGTTSVNVWNFATPQVQR